MKEIGHSVPLNLFADDDANVKCETAARFCPSSTAMGDEQLKMG